MNEKEQQMENHRTVKEVFNDFKGRQLGIIKALTTDFDEFYKQLDPNKPSLCLYGYPNQQWQTHVPSSSELPEPKSGINFLRDDMNKNEFLSMVALHCDAWLYAVACYFGAKSGFDSAERKCLFGLISDLSTTHEVVMSGKEFGFKKRVRKDDQDPFPVELWIEILSRLPVKSVMRFRSVCKTFFSIVNNPGFVSKHFNNAHKENDKASLVLVAERPHLLTGSYSFSVRCCDTNRRISELDFEDSSVSNGRNYSVEGCINGVVLLSYDKGKRESILDFRVVLWNPLIRKTFEVPPIPFSTMHSDWRGKRGDSVFFGFGFESSHCDPMVVAIVHPCASYFSARFITANVDLFHYRAESPGLAAVYSHKVGSWRRIDIHPPSWWHPGPQAFLNQAIHWIGVENYYIEEHHDVDSFIISFDLRAEVFRHIELPYWQSDGREDLKLGVIHEKLALFDMYADNCKPHIVWVMEEYGLRESWAPRYKLIVPVDRFLYFKDAESLFFMKGSQVKMYNNESKVTTDLDQRCYAHKFMEYRVFAYKESLVLLLANTTDGNIC